MEECQCLSPRVGEAAMTGAVMEGIMGRCTGKVFLIRGQVDAGTQTVMEKVRMAGGEWTRQVGTSV